jgi:hypothetical protein
LVDLVAREQEDEPEAMSDSGCTSPGRGMASSCGPTIIPPSSSSTTCGTRSQGSRPSSSGASTAMTATASKVARS